MKPKLSIVIPTYNRIDMLKELLAAISDKLGNYEYEIVIADDASSDTTKAYFEKNASKKVLYTRSDTNQGVFKNILAGIKIARADAVWVISDDDSIGETKFAIDAADAINGDTADLVFGKMAVKHDSVEQMDNHRFKAEYTSQEFINDWFKNIDHICFSSIIYKKSILLESFPQIDGYMGNTLDYHIIYHAVRLSKKILFIDKIAYIWTKSQPTSLSGKSKNDLLFQMMNIFAFPLANFSSKRDYDVEFFNKYILDAVNILVSNYYISHNDKIFASVVKWINENQIEKLYIYGKGEVGIMLKQYLNDNKIDIEFFIDDTVEDGDCIKYNVFLQNKSLFGGIGVILATYKCDVAFKIGSRLGELESENIKIISLYALSRESNV